MLRLGQLSRPESRALAPFSRTNRAPLRRVKYGDSDSPARQDLSTALAVWALAGYPGLADWSNALEAYMMDGRLRTGQSTPSCSVNPGRTRCENVPVSLRHALSKAKDFSSWLHDEIDGKAFTIDGPVDYGVCLLQHSWDLADAIVILLERGLPGPAWTLARPLCEGFLRGVWILHCASGEELQRFHDGQPPRLQELLQAMAADDATAPHVDWISANAANQDIFHDFTHGGVEVALRRIGQNVVGPNYSESELEYLVGLGVEATIRIGYELFSLRGDTERIQHLCERVQAEWQRQPLTNVSRNRVARGLTSD